MEGGQRDAGCSAVYPSKKATFEEDSVVQPPQSRCRNKLSNRQDNHFLTIDKINMYISLFPKISSVFFPKIFSSPKNLFPNIVSDIKYEI